MPPKRLAHLQALRHNFTEESSCAVVEKWGDNVLPELAQLANDAVQARRKILSCNYTADAASQVPSEVLSVLRRHQDAVESVVRDVELIRTVILVRIPEVKEEDNLGVAVQHAVLRVLDRVHGRAVGGNGGDKDGGVSSLGDLSLLKDYLAARRGVEEKFFGTEKDTEAPKKLGPSVVLELQETDAQVLLKLSLGVEQLAVAIRAFMGAYALNWKKLIQPRTVFTGQMTN